MIYKLIIVLFFLLTITSIGYVFVILKEKMYLHNNIILLEHRELRKEDLNNIDIKHFMFGAIELMAGDEVKVILQNQNKLKGTILGASKTTDTIAIVTNNSNVTKLNASAIKKMKIISRYGRFFV